jgi:hypothetical protein
MSSVEIRFLEDVSRLTVLEVDTPESIVLAGDLDRALAGTSVQVVLAERRRMGGRLRQGRARVADPRCARAALHPARTALSRELPMTFAEELCESVCYEAAAWSLAVRLEWRRRGWPLPGHWPYSLAHARGFLQLPSSIDPAVISWLTRVAHAGARLAWARQEMAERAKLATSRRSEPCRRSA